MKITLYWSSFSNRIFYVKENKVYSIDGERSMLSVGFLKKAQIIHKIGEI